MSNSKQNIAINEQVLHHPFGMPMPGRSYTSENYRFGFNGMEKDDEVAGQGNSYTAEFWQYDSRLGKRWNTDPVIAPWESPYATFRNNPIFFNDPSGDCPKCEETTMTDDKGNKFTAMMTPEAENMTERKNSEMKLFTETLKFNNGGFDANDFDFIKNNNDVKVFSKIDLSVSNDNIDISIKKGDYIATFADNYFKNVKDGEKITTRQINDIYNETQGVFGYFTRDVNNDLGVGIGAFTALTLDLINSGSHTRKVDENDITANRYIHLHSGLATTSSVKLFSFFRYGENYMDSIEGFSRNKNWLEAIEEVGGSSEGGSSPIKIKGGKKGGKK